MPGNPSAAALGHHSGATLVLGHKEPPAGGVTAGTPYGCISPPEVPRAWKPHPLTPTPTPCLPQDSALAFHVQLESGHKLQAHIYVVYDEQPSVHSFPARAVSEQAASPQQPAEHDCADRSSGAYGW